MCKLRPIQNFLRCPFLKVKSHVLWGTKRWKIIYNKRKYSKFYNCGGAKWPIKEAKPTFWCFEKTGPPSQKYNSWRWGKNTTQLQLPPPLISAKTWSGPVLGQCVDWSLLCEFVWKCKSIGLQIHSLSVSEILCLVTWHCQTCSYPAHISPC